MRRQRVVDGLKVPSLGSVPSHGKAKGVDMTARGAHHCGHGGSSDLTVVTINALIAGRHSGMSQDPDGASHRYWVAGNCSARRGKIEEHPPCDHGSGCLTRLGYIL